MRQHMPEMLPTYERLCALVGNDVVAARFLTGYQPPAYISACSQAVLMKKGKVQLVRNYDYHPDLIEGTLLLSAWNGRKVIANSDCLSGVLDGMNEDGLAISLAFGGRKAVGQGFGIPFILRYVLEFCTTVQEAVEALTCIPSHMSYNVTVTDRSGAFKTVQMAPDRPPFVTDAAMATNYQGRVDWPENAQFNRTVERAVFLENLLMKNGETEGTVMDAFLQPPLYNTRFREGFGTLYTAVYSPMEGTVQLRWPNDNWLQTFDGFQEGQKLITLSEEAAVPLQDGIPAAAIQEISRPATTQPDWQQTVAESMGQPSSPKAKKLLKTFRSEIKRRGQIPLEMLADFWSNMSKAYWQKWRK